MEVMKSSIVAVTIVAGLGLLAGCTGEAQPTKQVQSPEGGKAVLTTEQRAVEQKAPAGQRATVARASFEQPVEEPQVLKPFEQWTEQEAAADALGRIGAAAVPELTQALMNPDAAVRLKAVEVLGRMGQEAQGAVAVLVTLLNDPDEKVRKATARTLGQIGPAAKDAVPALVRTLLEPETTAR